MGGAVPAWDLPTNAVPVADLPENAVPVSDLPENSASSQTSPAPQKKMGFGEALGLSALGAGARASGAITGGELGAEGGAALGALGGPAAPVTVPAGAILGGLIGGGAGYFGADKLLQSAGQKDIDARTATQPTAAALGEAAVDVPLAAYGGYQGLRALAPAARSVAKGLAPRKLIEAIGKPSTISDVGENITKKVEGNLKALVKDRKPKADALFDKYLAKGKQFEENILTDYKNALADYYAKGVGSGKLSVEQIAAVQKAASRLTDRASELGKAGKAAESEGAAAARVAAAGRKIPPRITPTMEEGEKVAPGIGALEKERRIWNDIADGYDVKGAEGITAQAARDIRDLLTGAIQKYVPQEFKAAMEGYQKLSEPINRFNTALGRKVTIKADDYLPEVAKTDPALVPRSFFKSRQSVNELKELSGDPKFAETAARDHVANDLAGKTTSDEVSGYLQKNRDWLQEFPSIQKQLADISKTLKTAERTKTGAKYVGGGVVGAEALSKAKQLFGGP